MAYYEIFENLVNSIWNAFITFCKMTNSATNKTTQKIANKKSKASHLWISKAGLFAKSIYRSKTIHFGTKKPYDKP